VDLQISLGHRHRKCAKGRPAYICRQFCLCPFILVCICEYVVVVVVVVVVVGNFTVTFVASLLVLCTVST
jgi:hypothetical protein